MVNNRCVRRAMHAEMSSALKLQDLGSLVPRRYQEEVFRRARQGMKSLYGPDSVSHTTLYQIT